MRVEVELPCKHHRLSGELRLDITVTPESAVGQFVRVQVEHDSYYTDRWITIGTDVDGRLVVLEHHMDDRRKQRPPRVAAILIDPTREDDKEDENTP